MVILEYSVEKPLNREPEIDELVSSFFTAHGYDRNHGPIPHLDGERHTVKVDGRVAKNLELSMFELQHDFEQHEVLCALQCAGNRRHTMRTQLKEVDGIDWGDGAVMNCSWKGPRLRDVLKRAGLKLDDQEKAHVAFACFQTEVQEDTWYGGSIELERAMKDEYEVILALEMNGKTLPINHGYPVRMVVPGVAGARSVKWLDRITVQLAESKNFYQKHDYKILPPAAVDKRSAEKYWDSVPAIQDMPVNSVITSPRCGEKLRSDPEGFIKIEGYALPGGDSGPVVKVEVTADEQKTWTIAEIVDETGGQSKWCWVLWRAKIKLDKGPLRRVQSRAIDKGGNEQTAHPEWNLRGVAYNGYGESRDLEIV